MVMPLRQINHRKKWATRLLVFVLMASILSASIAFALDTRPASAHAFLLRTDPADGSVLLSAPKQMRLWFSESIDLNLTNISLQDGTKKTWQLRPYPDVNDRSAVIVNLPNNLTPNAYRLTWRTVSYSDLHGASGAIVFGIGQAVSREGSRQTQNTTLFAEVAFRWIGLLSFAAVIGCLANILFLFPSVRAKIQGEQQDEMTLSSLQRKIISLALWCSIVALFAGLFALWSKAAALQAGAGSILNFDWKLVTSLASAPYIKRELASEGCLIAIALLILYWLKRENEMTQEVVHLAKGEIRNVLLFSFVILWIFFQALNSHALAFNTFSPARVIAYAFHLLGAGMWIGGQIALIFFIAPRLRTRSEYSNLAREIYTRFGGIAAMGVAILIITGLYSAGQQVASLDALLLTPYGKALILKTAVVTLAGLIGLSHASHFHPKVATVIQKLVPAPALRMIFGKAKPASTLRLELLGGVTIFLLAAFMGSTPPARGPQFDPPAQAAQAPAESTQSPSLSSMADDLLVNFSIKPNQPGQNFISLGVYDTRRPSPGPIEEVVVTLLPPGGRDEIQIIAPSSESDSAGNYHVSTDAIGFSGDWKVSVLVHRAGLKDAVLDLPWTVSPSASIVINRPVLISSRPLAPWLTLASLLLSILLGGAWLVVVLRQNLFRLRDDKASVSQEIRL